MNAMKLNAICLKLFQHCFDQSLRSLLQEGSGGGRKREQRAGFVLYFSSFLISSWKSFFGNGFAPDRGEMNAPLEASDTLVPKCTPNDQLRYSALRQLMLWQNKGLQGSCEHKASLQCMIFQNQPPRSGKSSTQLTPDLWCWGKRTLSLSTVAGLTFAEGNSGLIFMTFFYSWLHLDELMQGEMNDCANA